MPGSKLISFSASYETEFRVPIFDLGAKHAIFVESLYRRVARHWIPELSDFKFSPGASAMEPSIRLSLFRGSCAVNLNPNRVTIDFRDAVSSDEMTILEVTAAVLAAISDNISVDMFGAEWTKLWATIGVESEAAVDEFLSAALPTSFQRNAIGIPGVAEHGGLKTDYEIPGAWNCGVDISRRWGRGNEKCLFVAAQCSFHAPGKDESWEDPLARVVARADILRVVVADVLRRAGLSISRDEDSKAEVSEK